MATEQSARLIPLSQVGPCARAKMVIPSLLLRWGVRDKEQTNALFAAEIGTPRYSPIAFPLREGSPDGLSIARATVF